MLGVYLTRMWDLLAYLFSMSLVSMGPERALSEVVVIRVVEDDRNRRFMCFRK